MCLPAEGSAQIHGVSIWVWKWRGFLPYSSIRLWFGGTCTSCAFPMWPDRTSAAQVHFHLGRCRASPSSLQGCLLGGTILRPNKLK